MFFKNNRKKFLIGFFGVAVLALGIWLVRAPEAKALCSMGCKLDAGFCYFDVGNDTTADKICIMGLGISEDDFWAWDSSCTGAFGDCKQNACNGGWANGTACSVLTNKGGSCDTAGNYNKADGRWDASSNSCIQCSGALKIYQIGNTSNLNYTDISDVFSTACWADTACQEKTSTTSCNVGANCESRGNTCVSGDICDANGKCQVVPTCDTNPTLKIKPATQSGAPGDTLTYTLDLRNEDDAACPTASRTFNLSATLLPGAGWISSFHDLSLTAAKGGGTKSTTFTLRSPGGATPGNYNFKVKAQDPKGSAETSGIYTVKSCPVGTFIKFSKDEYTKGSTLLLEYGTVIGNNYTWCIYNNSGSNVKEGYIGPAVGIPNTGFNVSTGQAGDNLGIWTVGLLSGIVACPAAAPGCISATDVVECIFGADCIPITGDSKCNFTTNKCYTCGPGDAVCIAGCTNPPDPDCPGGGAPACPANLDNCEGIVPILALPCKCGGAIINVGENKYCCGAPGGGVFDLLPPCEIACLVGAPVSAPLCEAQLTAADVGKECGGYTVTAGDIAANPWCCAPAGGVAMNQELCRRMNPDCDTGFGGGGCVLAGRFPNPLCCEDVMCLIDKVVSFLFYLTLPVVTLMIIIGAFLFLTAGGEAQKVAQARSVVLYALVGFMIVLLSRVVIEALKLAVGAN